MTLQIKNSWDEVTIAEFCEIQDIMNSLNYNELEKKIKVLAVLAGVKDDEFDSYLMTEIHEMFKNLEFLQYEPTADVRDYYVIGGKRYKLIKNVNELTAGQFIDLSNYTKDKSMIADNMHLIIATLLLPAPFTPAQKLDWKKRLLNKAIRYAKKGKGAEYLKKKGVDEFKPEFVDLPVEKYLQTPLNETAENIFENMPISQAMGISVFFYLLLTAFLEVTQTSLESELKQQLRSISKMLEDQPGLKVKMDQIVTIAETGFNGSGTGLPQ